LARTNFMAFWFKFGILLEHRSFTLHWTNEWCLRLTVAIRWTNDRQTNEKPILSCLGIKASFSFSLKLMLGFSKILRLWSLKEICWRSRAIKVSKIHMDTCYYHFPHSVIILCIKTCMFRKHMKYTFYYCELYFVKMCD
jgi:hypothetical protein